MKRRTFLKSSLFAAGMFGLGSSPLGPLVFAEKPVPTYGDPKEDCLTTYNYDSPTSAVWIRWKNNPVTCYRAETVQKYPYFYPLCSLKSGLSLISESAQPWPHHRGVFFGLDKVNGGNFWQNNPDKDRIVSTGITLGECTEKTSEFFNECAWSRFLPDGPTPIIADKRRFLLTILDDLTYTLDVYLELTALTDVTMQKTNHGFFGVRTSQDISVDGGGVLVNSEGQQTQPNTHGKPAKWMTSYGKRYGREDGLVEGVAIMSPPYQRKPFDENLWFTRDYGNFSPMPFDFLTENIEFPKDDVLKFAYRVVAYTGEADTTFLNNQWDEFAQLSEGKRS